MKRIDLNSKIYLLMMGVVVLLLAGSCSKDDAAYTPKLGDFYHGGIIFYIDATGKHGLIASPQDLSKEIPWARSLVVTNANSTTDGSSNTRTIINALGDSGSYAAKLCSDYNGGGEIDWFLPSQVQLDKLYDNRTLVGGFTEDLYYWSSTEFNDQYAWAKYFSGGGVQSMVRKGAGNVTGVRAVRAF